MTKVLERWSAALLDPAVHLRTAAVLVVGIIAAVMFEFIGQTQVESLRLEIVKIALQLVVFGLLVGTLKRAVDDEKAKSQFRTGVVTDLGRLHARIYCLRRDLWLRRHDPTAVHANVVELMKVRCDLGSVGHHVRTRADTGQATVIARIAEIRTYFEELIDETMQGAHDGIVEIGPKLHDFIAGADGRRPASSDYVLRFKAPYLQAKQAADPLWTPNDEQKEDMGSAAAP